MAPPFHIAGINIIVDHLFAKKMLLLINITSFDLYLK